jgi:hypothetical protein
LLNVGELRTGLAATRALHGGTDRLSLMPETGSPDDALLGGPVTRFLVEVPGYTIELLVRFGWLRGDQQDDLPAIMRALRDCGQTPSISRIT